MLYRRDRSEVAFNKLWSVLSRGRSNAGEAEDRILVRSSVLPGRRQVHSCPHLGFRIPCLADADFTLSLCFGSRCRRQKCEWLEGVGKELAGKAQLLPSPLFSSDPFVVSSPPLSLSLELSLSSEELKHFQAEALMGPNCRQEPLYQPALGRVWLGQPHPLSNHYSYKHQDFFFNRSSGQCFDSWTPTKVN